VRRLYRDGSKRWRCRRVVEVVVAAFDRGCEVAVPYTLTTEALEGVKAHNAHKPEPCYNENWNSANHTGSMRARFLCVRALTAKYGICDGPMKYKRITKQLLLEHTLYQTSAETREWALKEEPAK